MSGQQGPTRPALRVAIVGAGRVGGGLARQLGGAAPPPIVLDLGDDLAPVAAADAIVEAVPEDLATKRAVVDAVRRIAPRTPLLSTTSSMLPSELSSDDPMLGLWHPFTPMSRRRVVEIAVPPDADAALGAAALRLAAVTGRTAITVAPTPGLVGNRLLKHLTHAGMEAWERSGSLPAVERAFVAAGLPLGPHAIVRLVGVATSLAVSERFASMVGPRYAPPRALIRLAQDREAFADWAATLDHLADQAAADHDPPSPDLRDAVQHAVEQVADEIAVLIGSAVATRAEVAVICRHGLGWPDQLLEPLGLAGGAPGGGAGSSGSGVVTPAHPE